MSSSPERPGRGNPRSSSYFRAHDPEADRRPRADRRRRPQRPRPDHPLLLPVQARHHASTRSGKSPAKTADRAAIYQEPGRRRHRRGLHGPGRPPGLRREIPPAQRPPPQEAVRRPPDDLHRRPLPAPAGRHRPREGPLRRMAPLRNAVFLLRPRSSPSRPSTWSSSSSRRSTARPRPTSSPSSTPSATARSTDDDIARLNRRLRPDFVPPDDDFYITLTSTNDLAAARNREKLTACPAAPAATRASSTGEFDRSSLPTEERLELKPGAQVMLLNNDRHGRWVNGTIGRIDEIVRAAGRATTSSSSSSRTGPRSTSRPNTWELFHFRFDAEADRIDSRGGRRLHPVPAQAGLGHHHPQEPGQDVRQGRHRHRPGRLRPRPGLCRPQPLHELRGPRPQDADRQEATSGWTGGSSAS